MNYKTLLGATAPTVVSSYDGSGIVQNPTNVDITNPADRVEVKPNGSEANVDTSGAEVPVDPTGGNPSGESTDSAAEDTRFNPTLILGVLAVAYFIFIKKKK